MTDPALREKLRLIRDSDHPASPWARNVVQCLDDLKEGPDNHILRALGQNVAMMERAMHTSVASFHSRHHLTPEEIAAIFGLGAGHQ